MRKSVYSAEGSAVAATMRDARIRAGLQQAELAARIDRDQSLISNVERGHRRLDLIEFYRIALALGCEPVELFSEVASRLREMR